jgi:hypothetical protein
MSHFATRLFIASAAEKLTRMVSYRLWNLPS